jgi:hypothetical protein
VQGFGGRENQEVNIGARVLVVGIIPQAMERRLVKTLLKVSYPFSYP